MIVDYEQPLDDVVEALARSPLERLKPPVGVKLNGYRGEGSPFAFGLDLVLIDGGHDTSIINFL